MPGPVLALEDRSELGHVDPRLEPLRVHLLDRRREYQVDARVGRDCQIVGLIARIGIEIGRRAELRRVDEQAHDHGGALGAGGGDQGQVAGMQGAHRRNEADGAVTPWLERRANVLDRAVGVHATATVASARMS